jgi:hypothetical protein
VIGGANQRAEFEIDFGLPGGGYFMMVTFDLDAAGFHLQDHIGAQILVVIGWRDGEVAFFVPRAIAEIVFNARGIPAALFGVNVIKAVLFLLLPADIIENEELSFGAEEGLVGNAGLREIRLRAAGYVARS